MKKLLYLLVSLLSLQACNNEMEENWTPDSLQIAVTGALTDETGKIFKTGDGNWGVSLKPSYSGDLEVKIETDKAWSIEVKYITIDEDEWVKPAIAESEGEQSVKISIAANKSVMYRKASVVVRTKGSIPEFKTITIIQTDSDPIVEFNPEAGNDSNYDYGTKTLKVGYMGNSQTIAFWSNIENYRMQLKAQNQGDDISWVKQFKVDKDNGVVSFVTTNNFSGATRKAIIHLDADDFEGADYYLEQSASLYKNVLTKIDGISYNDATAEMATYSMKERTITLEFDSDQPLQADIVDKASLLPITDWATLNVKGGIVEVTIIGNTGASDREATVRVKSSNSDLVAQPAITWSFKQKFEILKVTLNQTAEAGALVFGPTARAGVVMESIVGEYETADETLKITTSENWLTFKAENGILKLASIEAYTGATPRTAVVTISNPNGVMTSQFDVSQYGSLNTTVKSTWKVEPGNSHTGETDKKGYDKLIDGKWRMDSGDVDSFWESKNGSPNYELIFDLNETQPLNSVGIMPRQQWTQPAPKDITVYVSEDKVNWTSLGKFPGFEKTEVENIPTNQYTKQIKWCKFPTLKTQYVKLSLGETYWTNTCCLEEVFIELQ